VVRPRKISPPDTPKTSASIDARPLGGDAVRQIRPTLLEGISVRVKMPGGEDRARVEAVSKANGIAKL
jgi:hypothetical protein